ncbi:MAG: DUF1003 domain-containing protein [Actinomycetota bacterium]|nr:DUF1003 domain-containing protein [Actinomycetota bacterium]
MTPPEKRAPEKRTPQRKGLDRIRPEASRERHARDRRLDTPLETHRPLVRRPSVRPDAFGVFAEQFARFMGTARFLIYMTVFVILWISFNVVGFVHHWDKYPFILLNLFFSTQASYAAPLILLAQNRQEVRDRVIAEQDRQANARAHADMEFLAREVASLRMALGEVATRDYLRSELRGLLNELDERASAADNDAEDSSTSTAGGSAADGETDHTRGPRA